MLAVVGCLAGCHRDKSVTVKPVEVLMTERAEAVAAEESQPVENPHLPVNPHGSMQAARRTFGTTPIHLEWVKPEGWIEVPSTQFRNPNFVLADHKEVECYVTILPGAGDNLLGNLNRWRKQMSLEVVEEESLNSLEKVNVIDRPSVFVNWTGTFVGMGSENRPNFRMLGILSDQPNQLITIKLTGRQELVEPQIENFKKFAASLKIKDEIAEQALDPHGVRGSAQPVGMPKNHPPLTGEGTQTGTLLTRDQIDWKLPAGWKEGGERPMRLASLQAGDVKKADVALVVLGGNAGGTALNIQRWYQQMGWAQPTPEEIDKLEKINVLGRPATLLDLTDRKKLPNNSAPDSAAMLGVVCEMGDQALFIKMIGPKSEVVAQRKAFVEFCSSLSKKQ